MALWRNIDMELNKRIRQIDDPAEATQKRETVLETVKAAVHRALSAKPVQEHTTLAAVMRKVLDKVETEEVDEYHKVDGSEDEVHTCAPRLLRPRLPCSAQRREHDLRHHAVLLCLLSVPARVLCVVVYSRAALDLLLRPLQREDRDGDPGGPARAAVGGVAVGSVPLYARAARRATHKEPDRHRQGPPLARRPLPERVLCRAVQERELERHQERDADAPAVNEGQPGAHRRSHQCCAREIMCCVSRSLLTSLQENCHASSWCRALPSPLCVARDTHRCQELCVPLLLRARGGQSSLQTKSHALCALQDETQEKLDILEKVIAKRTGTGGERNGSLTLAVALNEDPAAAAEADEEKAARMRVCVVKIFLDRRHGRPLHRAGAPRALEVNAMYANELDL